MSLIPAFEIDVWNAWILMLYLPLHPLIMIVIDKLVGVGDINKKMGDVPFTRTEKKIFNSMMTLLIIAFIYSIFLPLKLETAWLYVGLPVYIVGLIMWSSSHDKHSYYSTWTTIYKRGISLLKASHDILGKYYAPGREYCFSFMDILAPFNYRSNLTSLHCDCGRTGMS